MGRQQQLTLIPFSDDEQHSPPASHVHSHLPSLQVHVHTESPQSHVMVQQAVSVSVVFSFSLIVSSI